MSYKLLCDLKILIIQITTQTYLKECTECTLPNKGASLCWVFLCLIVIFCELFLPTIRTAIFAQEIDVLRNYCHIAIDVQRLEISQCCSQRCYKAHFQGLLGVMCSSFMQTRVYDGNQCGNLVSEFSILCWHATVNATLETYKSPT